jgi:hypothetical protein
VRACVCRFMSVSMRMCMCLSVCAYIHVWFRACVCVCACVRAYKFVGFRFRAFTHICVGVLHVCVCVRKCGYDCMQVCVYVQWLHQKIDTEVATLAIGRRMGPYNIQIL